MIVKSVREHVLEEVLQKELLESAFKKALFDLQNHSLSIQSSWTSMFFLEYTLLTRLSPTIEKLIEASRAMKSTTHVPLDETSELLARVKQMSRYLSDQGDQQSFQLIFGRILEQLSAQLIEVLRRAASKPEPAAKR